MSDDGWGDDFPAPVASRGDGSSKRPPAPTAGSLSIGVSTSYGGPSAPAARPSKKRRLLKGQESSSEDEAAPASLYRKKSTQVPPTAGTSRARPSSSSTALSTKPANRLPPRQPQQQQQPLFADDYDDAPAPRAAAVSDDTAYWTCCWRNPQTKKHKTWEGDGVLIVRGRKATLRDRDSGKELSSGGLKVAFVAVGEVYAVGGKEVEVESRIPPGEYRSGNVFTGSAGGAVAVEYAAAPPAPPPISKSAASFYASPFAAPPIRRPVAGSSSKAPAPAVPRHDPEAEGAIVMPRPSDAYLRRNNKKDHTIVDVVLDPHIGKALRPHQVKGVRFLYECVMGMKHEGQGAILADEMGLGKTIQSIALVYTLLKQNMFVGAGPAINRALIVCPVTLIKNWAREFKKWLGPQRVEVFIVDAKTDIKTLGANRRFSVVIIGYERLRSVVEELKKAVPPIGLVICDEGHRLKSAGTKTLSAMLELRTPRRIILSGTPVQNDLKELHAMADYVNPGLLDTYATFRKTFEAPIMASRDPNAAAGKRASGKQQVKLLNTITESFVLRRTAEVISGFLPPKHEHVVFIAPTALQLALYDRVLETPAARALVDDKAPPVGGGAHLQLIGTLKKLCNSPGILLKSINAKGAKADDDPLNADLRALCPPTVDTDDVALSGKLLALASLLKTLKSTTEEKIVVVSNFTGTLDVIEGLCRRRQYSFARLDGKTPHNQRQQLVDDFNKSSQQKGFVFLLSCKAGGTGLNLIGASRLVLFDSDWNPANDLQAMARIHREGQKRPCHITRFLTSGTLDEKIFQRQIVKSGLAASLAPSKNGDAAAGNAADEADSQELPGGSGGKTSDAFTAAELRAIFTLDRVGCQTHDLLGCQCQLPGGGAIDDDDDEDEPEPDDDAELPLDGLMDVDSDDSSSPQQQHQRKTDFVKASQIPAAPPTTTTERKKLSALKEWTHIDCTRPHALEEILDEPMRELVAQGLIDAGGSTLKHIAAPAHLKKRARSVSSDAEEDELAASSDDEPIFDPEDAAEIQAAKQPAGGQIMFIFTRTSNPLAASTTPDDEPDAGSQSD